MDALHRFERSLHIATEGNLDAYIGLCMVYRRAGRDALVDTTLERIRPEFAHSPRFWAFKALLEGEARCGAVPASIPDDRLREEKAFLLRCYDPG
jgi:hypothetical protein